MPLPVINASAPVTVPAVPQQVFNQWKLSSLHIDAGDIATSKYAVVALLSLVTTNPDGTTPPLPTAAQAELDIADLYAQAATDPTAVTVHDVNGNPFQVNLGGVMEGVVAYLIAYGQAQKKL